MAKKLELIPFKDYYTFYDENGYSLPERQFLYHALESYPLDTPETIWKSNEPFEATLRFLRADRGRSSTVFHWEDVKTQTRYPLFVSSISDILSTQTIVNGEVTALWHGVKRGANYGLALYK